MRPVKIITDSCSDLTPELMEKYDIDYCKMNTVYEGVTTPADLAWTAEDVHKFYGIIRDGNRITTTQVPVEEFNRVFPAYAEKGYDIVYIACSSKQSGSVGTGYVVAKQYMEEHPEVKIRCVDALNACMGEGLLTIQAAEYVKANPEAGCDQVADYTESIRKNVNQFCTVHSLDALKRAGRVKASAAFFGNLMGVKPILIADADGAQTAFKKVKGRQASIKEIVSLMKEAITEPENQTLYMVHSDCSEEEVESIKAEIKAQIPVKDIYVAYIGPIIGASIGADAIALYAMGKEVTFRIED